MGFQANLNGRLALVTGASKGIGRSLSLAFAGAGAQVAILARSRDALEGVKKEVELLGAQCLAVCCDISREDEVESAIASISSNLGTPDIVVNNAGIYRTEPVNRHSLAVGTR